MTIFGWDMSHYDAPSIGSAVRDGISFLTHKAGGDANDAELDDWWAGVRNLGDGVLLGAYWVLYPDTPVTRADQFLARLDASCPGWRDRPFILQVDCERWGGKQSTVPSKAEIQAFCDRLVSKAPRLRPIVYAPKWVYGDSLKGLNYPLWASSYVTGSGSFKSLYPGDTSSRWGAYSGQVPAILQYTSKATIGGQTTSDANAFRGTLAQLTALVAPGWEDDMPSVDDLLNADKIPNDINPGVKGQPGYNEFMTVEWALRYASRASLALDEARAARKDIAVLSAQLKTLTGKDFVDEQAVIDGVLAGLPVDAIVAAIPEDMAQQVVDKLAARMQA